MAAARTGDLARRVAHRRRELGLSRDEVARTPYAGLVYFHLLLNGLGARGLLDGNR